MLTTGFSFDCTLQIVICDRGFPFQPVSLLPTTLQEYEEALPDLPRDKVTCGMAREVETDCHRVTGAANIP